MTKKELVLQYLINHGTITSMESFEMFKATRLSGIIFNLKKEGYVIDTIGEKGKDCVYARYVYKGKIDKPYYQIKKEKEDKILKLEEEIAKLKEELKDAEPTKARDNNELLYDKKTGSMFLEF